MLAAKGMNRANFDWLNWIESFWYVGTIMPKA